MTLLPRTVSEVRVAAALTLASYSKDEWATLTWDDVMEVLGEEILERDWLHIRDVSKNEGVFPCTKVREVIQAVEVARFGEAVFHAEPVPL